MLKIKIVDCDQISSKTNIKNDNPIFIHKLSRQGKMMGLRTSGDVRIKINSDENSGEA